MFISFFKSLRYKWGKEGRFLPVVGLRVRVPPTTLPSPLKPNRYPWQVPTLLLGLDCMLSFILELPFGGPRVVIALPLRHCWMLERLPSLSSCGWSSQTCLLSDQTWGCNLNSMVTVSATLAHHFPPGCMSSVTCLKGHGRQEALKAEIPSWVTGWISEMVLSVWNFKTNK